MVCIRKILYKNSHISFHMKLNKSFYKNVPVKFLYMVDYSLISLFSLFKIEIPIPEKIQKVFDNKIVMLFFLLLIAVILRAIMVFLIPSMYSTTVGALQGDSLSYYFSGLNGATTGIYSIYWPPGFPFLISIFYLLSGSDSVIFLTAALIVMGALCGLLAYLISLKLFKNYLAALLAFLFVCVQPSFLLHSAQILSDTFAVLIFGISIYFMLKDQDSFRIQLSIFIGILTGFLILIRPNYFFMVIPYFFLIALSGQVVGLKVKKIIIFSVALILTLTPWMVYTDVIQGEPVISANGAVNFYIGNNPNSTGRYMEPYGLINANEGFQQSINYIISNPRSIFSLYVKKALLVNFSPYILPWELPQHHFSESETLYSYGMNIGFLIFALLGIRGILLLRKQKQRLIFFISIILLINLVFILFFVDGRLVMPLLFIYIIFGSYYIARILEVMDLPSNDAKLPVKE